MRSVTYNEFGKPSDVLRIEDRPTPETKAGEVRIKTILSSIHNHDLITIQGQYGTKPKLPALAGSEAVGTIDAIGEEVDNLEVGQRVVATGVEGTWAEYFTAPASSVLPIPDAIDDEMASQLIAMPMSALMLIEFLELDAGQWLIHNAANGAVGESLAMLAAERGIHTINVVRSKDSADELTEIGINENNVVSNDDDWKEQVRRIVGDGKISGAVDSVAGQSGGDLLSLLGHGGTMAAVGGMSGQPLALNPTHLIFKQAAIKGFWGGALMQKMDAANKNRLMQELVERAASGKLKLPTGGIYGLDNIKEAVSGKVQSSKKGKILLKP